MANLTLIIDKTQRIRRLNSAALILLGGDRNAWMGQPLTAKIRHPSLVRALAQAQTDPDGEYRCCFNYLRQDGKVLRLEIDIQGLAGPGGEEQWLVTGHPLTAPAAVDHTQREALHRALLDATMDGVIGLTRRGFYLFANEQACAILGYDHPEAISQRPCQLLCKPTCHLDQLLRQENDCPLDRVIQHQKTIKVDNVELYRVNGEPFPAEYRLSPLLQQGQVMGVLLAFRDLTQQRQREAEIQQLQRLETVAKLTSGVAHDFNNLLTVIQGNLSLLELEAPAESEGYIEDAITAVNEAVYLTQGLLTLSRQRKVAGRALDINAAVSRCLRLAKRTIAPKITLTQRLAEQPLTTFVDAHHLESALLNIIINAEQAILPDAGEVVVSSSLAALPASLRQESAVEGQTQWIQLAVQDTGIGMDEALLARACEPFFTTKKKGGTGLGLSSARSFVIDSGGHFRLQSQPNEGTRVEMYFPYIPTPYPLAADDHGEPQKNKLLGGKERILLVEDKAAVRRWAEVGLASLGYRVITAESGDQAQAMLQRDGAVDLVVSDVMMPGKFDGFDLKLWIHYHLPKVKVLLASGYNPLFTEPKDVYGYSLNILRKPYDLTTLAVEIRKILGGGGGSHLKGEEDDSPSAPVATSPLS